MLGQSLSLFLSLGFLLCKVGGIIHLCPGLEEGLNAMVSVNFQAESLARGNLPVNGGYCHHLGAAAVTEVKGRSCGVTQLLGESPGHCLLSV